VDVDIDIDRFALILADRLAAIVPAGPGTASLVRQPWAGNGCGSRLRADTAGRPATRNPL